LGDSIKSALQATSVMLGPGVEFEDRLDLAGVNFVLGDSNRLTQVINNMVSNAMKFTSHGKIIFSASVGKQDKRTRRTEVLFSCQDSGIGMDEVALSRLFKPFSQADSSMARKYGGTGLGLSITKTLVELMGGEITVKSTPRVGTTFSWNIVFDSSLRSDSITDEMREDRITERSNSFVETPNDSLLTFRKRQTRILVVEDNTLNQKIIETMLHQLCYDVTIACNGVEGVETIQNGSFDAVLMDFQMPKMSGVEATRAIREMGYTLPIIGLSANADEASRRDALEAGMCGVVAKPMKMIALKLAIESALSDCERKSGNIEQLTSTRS